MPPLRIDFLRRRPPASLLGWTLMLAGLVGLLLAAWDYAQAREEFQSTLDHAERQSRSAKAKPRTAAPTLARDTRSRPSGDARRRHARR